ncbi:2'-5' RNA ligase family protein [Stella sp.]|uniref:2'-5' RNA ligase family protein n=1 Tax=Stella sp. TaxID=2912054 RepID=UPI0035AE5EEB
MAAALLAVIARPAGRPADLGAIDRLRRRFDPRHGRVPAHVTLVFPIAADARAARRHLAAVAVHGSIAIRLGRPEPIRTGRRGWYVVLPVAAAGAAAVARLHHALARGPFAGNRRGSGPYRAHLTVAAGLDAPTARRVRRRARRLAHRRLALRELELVAWDGSRLTVVGRRDLSRGGTPAAASRARP